LCNLRFKVLHCTSNREQQVELQLAQQAHRAVQKADLRKNTNDRCMAGTLSQQALTVQQALIMDR
jgi:hypothetical protein